MTFCPSPQDACVDLGTTPNVSMIGGFCCNTSVMNVFMFGEHFGDEYQHLLYLASHKPSLNSLGSEIQSSFGGKNIFVGQSTFLGTPT